MTDAVLAGYAAAAETLIPRYEAVAADALFRPLSGVLPAAPARIIDLGAGTGRDAAWFASRRCEAVAVEPVAALREAGQRLHGQWNIEWIDDALPGLARLKTPARCFDIALVNGVWHRLDDRARLAAWPGLRSLSSRGGVLVLSLRHGPGHPLRPVFAVHDERVIGDALARGWRLLHRHSAPSVQRANRAAGVWWTWLAFAAS